MKKHQKISDLVVKGFSEKNVLKSYSDVVKKGLWKSEKKLFKKYFKRGSLLDIGCGAGRTTIPLAKMGFKVTGIDITPAMIKKAKIIAKEHKVNISYSVGDATALKFKNNSFDNVLFSFNGWNYIALEKQRLNALNEVYRVLKPKGHFIFTSHIRKGYHYFWFKQWLKQYILKPLGFKLEEIEFGDRFYKEGAIGKHGTNQYIHIPKLSTILKQIKKAGFELILFDRRDNIVKEELDSFHCTFFVLIKNI